MKNFQKMDMKRQWMSGDKLEQLEQYGYTKEADPKQYNEEAVLTKLYELSDKKCTEEESLILFWSHTKTKEENYDGLYLAGPVMMAMILKEYGLAEKLIDQKYSANDLAISEQFYLAVEDIEENSVFFRGKTCSYIVLHITQMLMAWSDIPNSLYRKICGDLIGDNFCYFSDYWNNPFLMVSDEILSRKKIPSMRGIKRLWEYDRNLLEGMMVDLKEDYRGYFCVGELEEQKKLVRHLLVYFSGMWEDLKYLLDKFHCRMNFVRGTRESEKYLKFWIKLLPEVKQACSYNEESREVFFEFLLELYSTCSGYSSFISEKDVKKLLAQIAAQLEVSRPEQYTFDDFLTWLESKVRWTDSINYSKYFQIWKYYVKADMTFDKQNEAFWEILENVFGTPILEEDEDEWDYSPECRERNKQNRLTESILLMELIDGSHWNKIPMDENEKQLMAYLSSVILDFKSDELLFQCLRCGLISKEVIPALIKSAFQYDAKRLIPVLVLYQTQKA